MEYFYQMGAKCRTSQIFWDAARYSDTAEQRLEVDINENWLTIWHSCGPHHRHHLPHHPHLVNDSFAHHHFIFFACSCSCSRIGRSIDTLNIVTWCAHHPSSRHQLLVLPTWELTSDRFLFCSVWKTYIFILCMHRRELRA